MKTKLFNNVKWFMVIIAIFTMSANIWADTTKSSSSFSSLSGNIGSDANLSYSTGIGGSTNSPEISGSQIKLYRCTGDNAGNILLLTANNGVKIKSFKITFTGVLGYRSASNTTAVAKTNYTSLTSGTAVTGLDLSAVQIGNTATGKTQAFVSAIEITYSAGCANNVTIQKGSETNGTFTLTPNGSQASCDGVSVSVAASPNTNYYVSSVSESGASASPTITGSGNSWTVSYAANTTGTSTISVTFALKTLYTVKWYNEGTEITGLTSGLTSVYSGDKVTGVPSNPSSSCSGEFIGWVRSDAAVADKSVTDAYTTQPTAPTLFTDKAGSPTITGNTAFHAVYRMPKPD